MASWLENALTGEQGPPGPPGDAQTVRLTSTRSPGDVVCSANSPTYPTAVALATAANVTAAGGALVGVLRAGGDPEDEVTAAGPGEIVEPSVTGLTSSATSTPVIADPTTGRCVRKASPDATDTVVGIADAVGNLTIGFAPGLISGAAERVTLVGTGTGPAGKFAIGDVVCSANDASDKTKAKLATTANLASADPQSIRVMLETGSAGDVRQAAGPGDRVTAAVLGLSAGTAVAWVTVAAGRAVLTPKESLVATQWVVGQADPNRNTTIMPFGPGEAAKKTIARFGAIGDNTTDDTVAVQAFFDSLVFGEAGYVENPPTAYLCKKPITKYGGGSLLARAIRVYGELEDGCLSSAVGVETFRFALNEPHGTGASITSYGNGSGSVTFTANATTDEISFTPGPSAYAKVRFTTTGVLPAGLTAGVDRYLVETSAGVCKVATSLANAVAGTVINITDAGTGTHTATVQASGSNMMVLALGTYTGSYVRNADGSYTASGSYTGGATCRRVTAQEKEEWIGRWVSIPVAVGMTAGVGGEWIITDAGDDWIAVEGGASGADTNIAWRINLPCFDIRCRDFTMSGIFIAPASTRLWCGIEINHSPLANTLSVANLRFNSITLVELETSASFRHAISIARAIVPSPGNANFTANGDGRRQLWHPTQVDTIHFYDCSVAMPPNKPYAEGSIEHASNNGQSRDSYWIGGNIYARSPYLNPSRGSVGSSGQMDFERTSFSTPDTIWTLGGANSRPRVMRSCYAEGVGRICVERGSGTSDIKIQHGGYGFSATSLHPSCAMIGSLSAGPLEFDSQIHGADGTPMHLVHSGSNSTTKEHAISIRGYVKAATVWTGSRGRLASTTSVGGLLRFAGTETFGVTVDAASKTFTADAGTDVLTFTAGPYAYAKVRFTTTGTLPAGLSLATDYWLTSTFKAATSIANALAGTGVNITDTGTGTHTLTVQESLFTCSQANFDAACGFTVDLKWVQPWQFMMLVAAQTPAARAWADADGYQSFIEALKEVSGSVQVTTNTTPTVWPAFSQTGAAQQQVSKDTGGLVTISRGAGAGTDPAALKLSFDVDHRNAATDAQIATNKFSKRYYSAALGGNLLESVVGIASRATRIPARNLNGSIDISGASTEGAVTFGTNEDDTAYRVILTLTDKTGAPLSRSARVKVGTKAVGGFSVILDAAPGGADVVTVEWMITR